MRIFMLMNDNIRPGMSLDEIRGHETFAIWLWERCAGVQLKWKPEAGKSVKVPPVIAGFFLEAFAVDLPPKLRYVQNKDLGREIILRFALPVEIPISVKAMDDKVQFGFFDILAGSDQSKVIAKADDISKFISGIWSTFAHRSMLVCRFKNVGPEEFRMHVLNGLNKAPNLCLLCEASEFDEDTETQSFILKVMKVHWDDYRENEIRKEIEKAFGGCRMIMCEECGNLYTLNDGSKCSVWKHKGDRIELWPGCWEEVEEAEDGEVDVLWKWSCCGEQYVDEKGCLEIVRPSHTEVRDRAKAFDSTLVFGSDQIYTDKK
jgi:hypothetical protein